MTGADVVFVCCATWEFGVMQRLATKLAEQLAHGARVLSCGKPLPDAVELPDCRVRFAEVWHGVATLAWGQEVLVVHEVRRRTAAAESVSEAAGSRDDPGMTIDVEKI